MIPDGYYNVCELDEEAFRLLGAKLRLHHLTGRLQLHPGNVRGNNIEIVVAGSGAATAAKKRLVLNSGLAKLLGFSRETFEPGKTYTADEPHKLAIHREICVHLVGEPLQRSPLNTVEIHPRRERKVRGGGIGQRHFSSCSTNGWHRGLFPS